MIGSESLSDLLFELSSSERLAIMKHLQSSSLRLSDLAELVNLSLTEGSRHLKRLCESRLIERDSEGLYSLTPYGVLILELLPALDFISRNSPYFESHDLGFLPPVFVRRIGELSNGQHVQDMVTGVRVVELLYRNTMEYAWVMSEQAIVSLVEIVKEKVQVGVQFRSIFPERFTPPPGYTPTVGPKRRTLPEVPLRLMLNESEALIGFPQRDGRVDYALFRGVDSLFRGWCRDLFNYYWEEAKPGESELMDPP
jgi:predicted transcriptional regulator